MRKLSSNLCPGRMYRITMTVCVGMHICAWTRESLISFISVIANPMDLQSMLKKVKQKQYKSKREFQDDLDLIWSNCFTYNAAEVSGMHISTTRTTSR